MLKITNNKYFKHTWILYEQMNYEVGAYENNLQIDIHENREELFNYYYFRNNPETYESLSNKNFFSLKKLSKTNL